MCVADEYANLDVICNARHGSAIYDLAPQSTGKKGRPAKHGRRLSTETDFPLSDEKIGDYYIGVSQVLTNLFGQRKVHPIKKKAPDVCFSAPFFPGRCRYSAPGRKRRR